MSQTQQHELAYWYDAGLEFTKNKQYQKALECDDRILEIKPNDVDALNHRGVLLANLDRYEEAVLSYNKALLIKPNNIFVLTNNSNALNKLERYKEAVICYDKILKRTPSDVDILYKKSIALKQLIRYDEAHECCDAILEIKPDHIGALYDRGDRLRSLGRHIEAIEYYDKALAVKPDYVEVLDQKAKTLETVERHDEALKCYDKILVIKPNDVTKLGDKGDTLVNLCRYKEAIIVYDQALKIHPNDFNVLRDKVSILSILDRREESIQCFDQIFEQPTRSLAAAMFKNSVDGSNLNIHTKILTRQNAILKIKPDDVDALYKIGVIQSRLRRYDKALECYDRILEIKPDDITISQYKGIALVKLYRYTEAVECYNAILKIKPDDVDALYRKGHALATIGKNNEAIACYDDALVINPNHIDALINKGYVLCDFDSYNKALKCYDKILEINPDEIVALYSKNIALAKLGRYEESSKCYDKALTIKLSYSVLKSKSIELYDFTRYEEFILYCDNELAKKPDDIDVLRSKGVLLHSLDKDNDALKCYDRILEINPDDIDALRSKGELLHRLNKNDDALKCYDRILEINQDDSNILLGKADALNKLGRYEEALLCCDTVLKSTPQWINPILEKANTLVNLQRYAKAIKYYDQILSSCTPHTIHNKAYALNHLGRYEEALEFCYQILKMEPDDIVGLYNKCIALDNLCRYDEAIQCCKQALKLHPNDNKILKLEKKLTKAKIRRIQNNIADSRNQKKTVKLEQLTPEQKSLIPIIRDKWIDLALNGKTELKYSKELQDGINWIYQKANQKNTNPLIIITPSPYGAQLIANILSRTPLSIVQNKKLGKSIHSAISAVEYIDIRSPKDGALIDGFRKSIERGNWVGGPGVLDEITIHACSVIRDSVAVGILTDIADNEISVDTNHVSVSIAETIYKNVSTDITSSSDHISNLTNVGNTIRTDVFERIGSEIRDSVPRYIVNTIAKFVSVSVNDVAIPVNVAVLGSVWCDIGDHIKLGKIKCFRECNCLNDLCGRLSYLDYFDAIKVLKNKEFRRLRDTLGLGIWSALFFENVAILSMTPSKVLLDDNKRLHSVSEPAIQFRDGYSIYRIHGIEFDEKTFYDLTQRKIPVKDILQLENIEQRYVALEYYGFENILDELNARLIDESPRGNKLYEIDFVRTSVDIITTKFLKYSCPSTEKNYGSFVKPEITQADQAMAWKHNCTEQEYEVLRIEA